MRSEIAACTTQGIMRFLMLLCVTTASGLMLHPLPRAPLRCASNTIACTDQVLQVKRSVVRSGLMTMSQELISKADALHAENKPEELFAALEGADTTDVELAWRVCRAHHDVAEELVNDPARREQLLRDGLALAEATLKSSPDNGPVLKWYASELC